MIITWVITVAVFFLINLITEWQLPWMTQLILISPFVTFSLFLSFKRQGNALSKHQLIVLSVIALIFSAILTGLFSEDYIMISGAMAVLFPVVLVPYLLIMYIRNKKHNNGS